MPHPFPSQCTYCSAVPREVRGDPSVRSKCSASGLNQAATVKPTGASPSFSVNGTNGAKNATVTFDKAGSYTFTVTISDGTSSVTSSVNVTVNQTLTNQSGEFELELEPASSLRLVVGAPGPEALMVVLPVVAAVDDKA